jgi:general nucleoside transport system permease protein
MFESLIEIGKLVFSVSFILTVITASTPLLLAGAGELVAERSGVLNLGVEGMMIMGAACGFAGAYMSGSIVIGAACGVLAGAACSAIFAGLTLGLAVNQVAAGLALTIFGTGLSGLIGRGFVGARIAPAPKLDLPILTDLPGIGQIVFGQDGFVYLSIALIVGIWYFLYRTRSGLVLRAVGDNHASAYALGYPVLQIRLLAVLFGGACAGLAGAFLPLAYTPFFIPGMTAGRGWIAVALVVFASWKPGRLTGGAYLFGAVTFLQLSAQALGLGIPPQLMSSLPYLATVVVLVLISGRRGSAGLAAPASLGLVFVPDR